MTARARDVLLDHEGTRYRVQHVREAVWHVTVAMPHPDSDHYPVGRVGVRVGALLKEPSKRWTPMLYVREGSDEPLVWGVAQSRRADAVALLEDMAYLRRDRKLYAAQDRHMLIDPGLVRAAWDARPYEARDVTHVVDVGL